MMKCSDEDIALLLNALDNESLTVSRPDLTQLQHDIAEQLFNARLSRRQLFQLAAGVSLSGCLIGPLARAAARFDLTHTDAGARFTVGGTPLFSISASQFDGDPRISVRQSPDAFAVRLTQARFPGTRVPADFVLAGERVDAGWTARLRFRALDFDTAFPFEQWLLGHPVARSSATLSRLFANLGSFNVLAKARVEAVFLPNWTVLLADGDIASIESDVGRMADASAQIDLVPGGEQNMLLAVGERPRTRLWVSGGLTSARPVTVEPLVVAFLDGGKASGLLELATDESGSPRSAWSIESEDTAVGAGRLLVANASDSEALAWEGLDTKRLRVIVSAADGGQAKAVQALLRHSSAWCRRGELQVELSTDNAEHAVQAADGPVCKTHGLVVTRIVAPLAGADQAVFIRRGFNWRRDGTTDVSGIVCNPEVDDLRWLKGFHPIRRDVRVDDFDLCITRGYDGFDATVRFRDVHLVASLTGCHLQGMGSRPLIEFDVGPQHVQEEAVYISDLKKSRTLSARNASCPPSTTASTDEPLLSDEEICHYIGWKVDGATCKAQLDSARKNCLPGQPSQFEQHRRTAVAAYRKAQEAEQDSKIRFARALFAEASWLTFELKGRSGNQRLDFSLPALFEWGRLRPQKETRETEAPAALALVTSPLAARDNVTLDEQIRSLRKVPATAPRSIGHRESSGTRPPPERLWSVVQAPYRLAMTPVGDVTWTLSAWRRRAASSPVEIWSAKAERLKMRAVWSPDKKKDPATGDDFWAIDFPHWPRRAGGFRSSLDARDRHEIVSLSSGFGRAAKIGSSDDVFPVPPQWHSEFNISKPEDAELIGVYVPKPIDARLLMLTSYGASLKSLGSWSPPADIKSGALTVQLWDQNSDIGRDTKVVIEYKGFLLPSTTPCVLVKETERRLVADGRCVVARLVQRFFIRVPPFSRVFTANQQPFDSRAWPFPRCTTDLFVTPDLEKPECSDVRGLGQQAFWPTIAATGEFVEFPFADAVNGVKMAGPLLFVDNDVAHRLPHLNRVIRTYRIGLEAERLNKSLKSADPRPRKYVVKVLSGTVRFAPPTKPGDTSYQTLRFLLDVDIPRPVRKDMTPLPIDSPAGCAVDPNEQLQVIEEDDEGEVEAALYMTAAMEADKQPPFYPHLRQALIEPGQIALLSGQDRVTALVEFDGGYVKHGFSADANAGEIFLRFVDFGVPMSFSGNTTASGGVASPSTQIAALSRARGPIGGNADECKPQKIHYRYVKKQNVAARFHPANAFADPDPVAAGRRNDFDAREFFAKTLGDAKLLGVVRFVDILDVALKVSGNKFPTIIQEVERAIGAEAARLIVPQVQQILEQPDVATALKRVTRLNVAAEHLKTRGQQLLAAAGAGSVPGQVTQLATEYVKAAGHFAEEIKAVAADPKSLLPPDALRVLETVQKLKVALEALFSPEGLEQVRKLLVERLTQAFRAELMRLVDVLAQDPRFIKLSDKAREAIASIDALERDARTDADAMIRSMSRYLEALLRALIDVNHWSTLIDHTQARLCTEITTYTDALATALKAWAKRVYDQALALNKEVEIIKKKVDALPDNHVAERAFMELSDIVSSALAHARDFKAKADAFNATSVAQLCGSPLSDKLRAEQKKLVELLNAAFRGAQEALRKTPRLKEVLGNLPLPLQDQLAIRATGSTVAAEISRYIADGFGGAEVINQLKALQKRLTTVPRELRPAADWLSGKITNAVGLLEKIHAARDNFLAMVAEAESAVRSEANELRREANELLQAIMLSVIDVEDATRRLLQDTAGRLRQRVVDTLHPVSVEIARTFGQLEGPLKQVDVTGDSSVLRWLAPPLRERIRRLKESIGAIGQAPAREEDKLLAYFTTTIPAARDDLIALVDELRRVLGGGDLGSVVDMQKIADEIVEKLGIPTTARLSYDWATEVSSFPQGAGAIFEPLGTKRFSIKAVTIADLRGRGAPTYSVEGFLDQFKINLLGGTPFLAITFRPLTFTAGSGRDATMKVEIATVDFGGGLSFVKTLQEWLSPKSGVFVELAKDRPGVIVGYRFHEDIIQIAAFTLQNVSFSIACLLPFDNSPALIKACVGHPDKPILLSAGIYGGGAFVCLTARVEAIEALEASFEYGLVTAFKFGIASGTGRITAGVYIRVAAVNAIVAGFFNASGNADIAGLITIGAEFRVQIGYSPSDGRVSGYARFSVSVKIAFAEVKYGIDVAYARQGESGQSSGQSANSGGARPESLTTRGANPRPPETHRDKVLAQTPSDNRAADQSPRLLQPELWNRYWSAFEERIGNECR